MHLIGIGPGPFHFRVSDLNHYATEAAVQNVEKVFVLRKKVVNGANFVYRCNTIDYKLKRIVSQCSVFSDVIRAFKSH